MKKIKYLLLSSFIVSAFAFSAEKLYIFKFSETQINYHWQNLEAIKLMLDQSTLPHNQVKQTVAAIDSLQKDMRKVLTIDSIMVTEK